MAQIAHFIKTSNSGRSPDELLRARTGALAGVSPAAESALATLDIHTIFDLAASRTFVAAERLLAVETTPASADARLNAAPADMVDVPPNIPAAELAQQPIAILRRIGATRAPQIAAALDVKTVRDLALWPPFRAAKEVLAAAFFPERQAGADVDAPADLLPTAGEYPTERVFYRKLLIDASPQDGSGTALEDSGAIDVVPGLLATAGFQRLATGALLTFSQSWFSQGLTLGQLLHSTSLAPGESTRIAMIDWTRRTRASATESISETEELANTQTHNRALSEVTDATASEFQTGTSQTSVTSKTGESGSASGLELGPLALGRSSGWSKTTTDAMSASSSFGARDLSAQFSQAINDSSQQNASSARTRRASIVREVSQEEHETISTRVVTNYNHMHALTVQYYEVVQAFRATTQLERAERCLFVPLKLLNFRDAVTVERWRNQLYRAALTPSIAKLLAELGTVLVTSQLPRFAHLAANALIKVRPAASAATAATAAARDASEGDSESSAAPVEPETPATPPASTDDAPAPTFRKAGWDMDQLARLGRAAGLLVLSPRTNAIYVSDEAVVLGLALRDGTALRFSVRRRDGSEAAARETSATGIRFGAGLPIRELKSISLQYGGSQALTTALILHLNLFGTIETLDVPIYLQPGGASSTMQEVIRFDAGRRMQDLTDHLAANALYYSQAIYRSLDGPQIASLLARFTFRGLPLAQLVDHQPVAVNANFLVFKMNILATGDAEDPRLAEDVSTWRQFLLRAGLDRPVPRSEIIPLPSGGVFGEAVLGRNNSAERLQMERFWNWQDSPIPNSAPEIAAIAAGSRAQAENLLPGQLSAPVVSIQSPVALPDPTGVAAITAALQNGGMFRDMSGLAQTAALAQAAQQVTAAGATAASQQAGQNLLTVMDQHTQRLRIAAQLAAQMAGVPVSGATGGGAGPPGDRSLTEKGGQIGAARELDAESGGGAPPAGAEADTLRNQLGTKGRQLANKVLDAAGVPTDEVPTATPSTPTRGVGQKQSVPNAMNMVLNVSSFFADPQLFGTTPVQFDATIEERDGTRIWQRKGAAAPTFSGSLRTAETRLFLNVQYQYELGWPQPTIVSTNSFEHLNVAPGAKRLDAAVIVVLDTKTVAMPNAATAPDDATLAAAVKDAGIDVFRILQKPKVTPRSGGGFDAEVSLLRNVAVDQLGG